MLEICKKINDNYKEQKMSNKQKEHRISFETVKDKVNELLNMLKTNPSMNSYELFLIAAFSSGVYAPPRRSEFAFVKIKNFDRRTENYLEITGLFSTLIRQLKSMEVKYTKSLLHLYQW